MLSLVKAVKEIVRNEGNHHGRHSQQLPRFDRVRWVPKRFKGMLPLEVMQRYQCIVVGGTQRKLTVAFASRQNAYVLAGLKKITGKEIFPVLMSPARLRRLLARAAAWQPQHDSFSAHYYVHRPFIRALLRFYTAQWKG